MPIANCFAVAVPQDLDADAIAVAWSNHSGITSDEMSVNVVPIQQGGKHYAVMAWLYLPSLWSDDDVTALGEGLGAALVDTFEVKPSAVQVVTSIVPSGSVVEDGRRLQW